MAAQEVGGSGPIRWGEVPCPERESETGDTGAITGEQTYAGGGGCTHAGGDVGSTVLLLWALRVLMGLLLPATCSGADLQHVLPYGVEFVGLRPATLGDPWSGRLSVAFDVAQAPLVARREGGTETVVPATGALRVGGSFAPGRFVRFGARLPIHAQTGELAGSGVGDVTLTMSAADPGSPVAVLAELDVPVGVSPYGTSSTALAMGITGRAGPLGGQVLARLQPRDLVGNVLLGSRLEAGFGVRTDLGRFDGTLELHGAMPVRLPTSTVEVPLEALLSLGVPGDRVHVRGAVAAGLTDGLGSPQTRFVLQGTFGMRGLQDHDDDGLLAPVDRCPREPEDRDGFRDRDGCPDPDNDADGLVDVLDACPDEAEVPNGWQDDDGCPDRLARWVLHVTGAEQWTVEQAGTSWRSIGQPFVDLGPPGVRSVRVEAEGFRTVTVREELAQGEELETWVELERVRPGKLRLRVADEDGRPLTGTARVGDVDVGFVDGRHVLDLDEGLYRVGVKAEGFRGVAVDSLVRVGETTSLEVVLERASVQLDGNVVVPRGRPIFARNEDVVSTTGLLDELARWMGQHEEVRLLRVEGHADPLGSSAFNYALSERRANGVIEALVVRGVERERLQAVASGEAFTGDGPVRQVTFTVLIWDEADPDGR